MKKLLIGTLGLLLFQSAKAAQSLPAYESFPTNYADNGRLGDIATLDAGNSPGSGSNLTNSWAVGLSYPGLMTSNNNGGVIANGTPSSGRDRGFQLSPPVAFGTVTNALYASFLLRIQTPTSTTNLIAHFAGGTGGGATPVAGVYLDQNNKLWISKSSATPATNTASALSVGDTHLIVFRYKYSGSGSDEVALWVDPASLGVSEANVPSPTISTTNGIDSSSVAAFDFAHRTTSGTSVGATGFKYFDEARVGTNWASVTPTGNPVSSSQPYITQALMSASGLVLRGTNGPANGVYQVLASTNVTVPLAQWPAIATNTFNANGDFDCTNPVSPADAQRFYRLLVGGQIIPPPVAPSITTQPTNQTVTVGQNAAFSVAADGTAPLSYQWYFNTNTPLANATSSSLIITNAQTTNAGGYSVIVTNVAGSVTSVVATLTVNPAPVAPSITTQPTNLTVIAGQNATFTVAADGTAPLRYQWYFNTNTALASATNASLTLTNVQATNAGGYSVRVTNSVGAATSIVATLTVLLPPSITTQPQNQIVTVSNNVSFTVVASGTAPLSYQWYFNTNTALLNATNSSLTISNAQTNNAGGYSVIVTNAYGSSTSAIATLTVNLSNGTPNFALLGFAALDGFNTYGYNQRVVGGTTGGAGGTHVQVWTAQDLANHLQSNATLIVEIMTNIDLGIPTLAAGVAQPTYSNFLAAEVLVRSNKTIYSTNGATLTHGTLRIGKPSLGPQGNIIIRNLKFRDLWEFDPTGNYDSKGWDYVHLEEGSHHVWVDHCDFDKVYDGIIDAVHGSDYLTVSWNVFRNQKKCSLIGHSDGNQSEDTNHLNVTFHHNYYVDVDERMPRMRFGNAHVFNLYCENLGGNGIQSTAGAATLVENVYFYHPDAGSLPTREENGGPTGTVRVVNSVIVNLPGNNVAFRQYGAATFKFNFPFASSNAPYAYSNALTPVAEVPYTVTNYAGVGKISF